MAYYYAGIELIDKSLGELRQTLKEEGLDDNTIIIFLTDNGATIGKRIYSAGLKGGKGSAYDGGHRVPFFFHWPAGKIKHGHDVDDLNAHFDLLPTLVDLLDLKTPGELDIDGRSFKKQLYEPELMLNSRTLFVEKQRTLKAKKWDEAVAMTYRWRLVNNRELYDIQADRAQRKNLIKDYPEVANQLREDFDQYWAKVSPNDREIAYTVVGHPSDKETFLSSEDWYINKAPWNHYSVAKGDKKCGSWHIDVFETGKYEVELRRWPKEAKAPIAGVPVFTKEVDAWSDSGPRYGLLYGPSQTPTKALPVKYVKLIIGDYSQIVEIDDTDQKSSLSLI